MPLARSCQCQCCSLLLILVRFGGAGVATGAPPPSKNLKSGMLLDSISAAAASFVVRAKAVAAWSDRRLPPFPKRSLLFEKGGNRVAEKLCEKILGLGGPREQPPF